MQYYLLIGGNLGNRHDYLSQAIHKIQLEIGKIIKISSLYETAAWGHTDQPDFLNQALCLETALEPHTVLEKIQLIEKKLGRKRQQPWHARTIDIDIIFCEQRVVDTPDLQIPHPFLAQRRFVLAPLAEIAPFFSHHSLQKTVQALLADCPDLLEVRRC